MASPFRSPRHGRLRIVHLLVWTGCVAALLGLDRLVPDILVSPAPIGWEATRMLRATALGTGFAGLVLALVRWSRRVGYPVHPGEWLWLALGIAAAAWVIGQVPFVAKHPRMDDLELRSLFVSAVLAAAVGAFGFGVSEPRWRWCFFLHALMVQFGCCAGLLIWLGNLNLPLQTGGPVPAAVLLLVVVLMDASQRRAYPWSHWVGVVTYFLGFAATIVPRIGARGTL